MIVQINELPEDGLKSSPDIQKINGMVKKNQNELYFLHLIDILNDLLLIPQLIFRLIFFLHLQVSQSKYSPISQFLLHSHPQLLGFQINPLSHTSS